MLSSPENTEIGAILNANFEGTELWESRKKPTEQLKLVTIETVLFPLVVKPIIFERCMKKME